LAEDLGERTEKATPKRRRDAREEGNVARSTDLASALMLGGVAIVIWFGFAWMLDHLGLSLERVLSEPGLRSVAPITWTDSVEVCFLGAIWAFAPLAFAIWCAALLSNLVQVGFLLAPKAIKPRFSKLNPIEGAKRVFGSRALVKAGLDSMKVLLVVIVVSWTVHGMHDRIMFLPMLPVAAALIASGHLLIQLALSVTLVLLLLGVLDYVWQKYKHEQDLKMSHQQVKDEFKQTDGDPDMKRRRLQFARQIAQQRIAAAVPKADVIVTNPEHISVAIMWNTEKMNAPTVIAMGADHLAMKIRQIAMKHSIPIMERKPLARALYAHVKIGQEIPSDMYEAVAEVLAFVYRLEGRMAV
jgi:flagellar biosynthetic protein FlhB